jgi:eukaryotic-like serine/threonine-protein kinase
MIRDSLHSTTRQTSDEGHPAPADRELPPIGQIIGGKYRVDGILGRGGMGVVVAGHQLSLDRPVAIKMLRGSLSEGGRERFTREAMIVAKMTSEHAVRVFDAAEDSGVPFIVMERLFGQDLASRLSSGPLGVELSVRYALEACEAIAEAHGLGVVHRDLKPSNCFLAEAPNGRQVLKVLDFGVSKQLDSATGPIGDASTTDTGLLGTPAYASPEQLLSPRAVDRRTDVWGLGIVLYQCLSGQRPFAASSLAQLGAAILASEPAPFPDALQVPAELRDVVWRCLEKRPEDRYQTVEELATALRSLGRQPRVRRWRALAVAAVALAGGAALLSRACSGAATADPRSAAPAVEVAAPIVTAKTPETPTPPPAVAREVAPPSGLPSAASVPLRTQVNRPGRPPAAPLRAQPPPSASAPPPQPAPPPPAAPSSPPPFYRW